MTRPMKILLLIPVGIAAITLFVFLGGTIVQLLWNWLLPPLFGVPTVTFWQALGLLALCRILFGGWHGGRGRRSHNWSPEEKERFRQRVRERWGRGPAPASAPNTPE